VAQQVHRHYPQLPILAISMLNDYESVKTMLEAGAMGYCLKSAGKDELLEALSALCQGERYVSPSLMRVLLNGQNRQKKQPENPLSQLTTREIDVLRALISGTNLTKIADELCLSKHTLESHRKNIYAKLDLHSINELMAFALHNKIA